MRKIVIIGANDFQNPLILKCKELGYETHVFAWKDGSIGEKTADFFYPISIVEKDAILEKCKEIQPDAVVTIASDLAQITVNYLCCRLGLVTNSEHSTLISTNKYEMRKALLKAGLPTPHFEVVSTFHNNLILNNIQLPCIVKPTDRSGSRSITKVEKAEDLKSAIERAVEDSFEKKAIVEEFIDGNEYSCECISFQGKHHFLALTKKYTTNSPHFIETGHMQPSDLNEEITTKVVESIFLALDALEITNGASHSEFRVSNNGEIRIIEIGARMGGDCIGSDLVRLSTGLDYLKMTIDVACGKEPKLEQTFPKQAAAIRFLFNHKDIEQFHRICATYPDCVITTNLSQDTQHAVIDSSSRLGYYILSAEHPQKLHEILSL